MSLWDTAKNFVSTEAGGAINTGIGTLATIAGLLPGVGGLIAGGVGLGSGAASTATSTTDIDKAVNTAGTVGTAAALPATIAGMLGINTGVALGGVSSIGSGLGMGAAATGGAGAAMGGAAVAGNVLAAGAAGYGVGTLAANTMDKYGKGGIFGTDEMTGKERSMFDVAADAGVSTDKFVSGLFGETAGTIAGGTVAGLGSILAAPVGAAQTVWNGASSLGKSVFGGLFS